MPIFDVCVIGAGLIGSAAAKYAACDGANVCLIGPTEPERETYGRHDIFGAWFDEGRITRHLDSDPVWTYFAAESIKRYRSIEAQSGIKFYTENGYLLLADADEAVIDKTATTAQQRRVQYEQLKNEDLKNKFPYFRVSNGLIGLYEHVGAGTINPRRLVGAQLKIFERSGGTWIKDVVVTVGNSRKPERERDVDCLFTHLSKVFFDLGCTVSRAKVSLNFLIIHALCSGKFSNFPQSANCIRYTVHIQKSFLNSFVFLKYLANV